MNTDPIQVSVVYDVQNRFALERGADDILRLSSNLSVLQGSANGSGRALRAVESDIRRFSITARNAAGNGVQVLQLGVDGLYSSLNRLGRYGFYSLTAGIAGSVYSMRSLGREFLNINEQFAGLEITLRSAFTSSRIARGLRDELVKITAVSPLPFKDLADITRAAATIPQLSTQIAKQYQGGKLSSPDGFLRGYVTLVEQLTTFRPDKNAEDATFSIREAVSGELRSLIRRFDIPPALLVAASGRSISDLKADPLGMLEAIKKAMNRIITPEAIREFTRLPSKLLDNLQEQIVSIPLLKTGEQGVYKQFNNLLGDIFDASTKLVSEKGDSFAVRFNAALSDILSKTVTGADRALESVLAIFNLDNRAMPGVGRIERIGELIARVIEKIADRIPSFVEAFESIIKQGTPAFLKLAELGGSLAASLSKVVPGLIALGEVFAELLNGLTSLLSNNPFVAAMQLLFYKQLPEIFRFGGQLAVGEFTKSAANARVAVLNALMGQNGAVVSRPNQAALSAAAALNAPVPRRQLGIINPSAGAAARNATAYADNVNALRQLGFVPVSRGSHMFHQRIGGQWTNQVSAMGGQVFNSWGNTYRLPPVTGPGHSVGGNQQANRTGMVQGNNGVWRWGSASQMQAAGITGRQPGAPVPSYMVPGLGASNAMQGPQLPAGFNNTPSQQYSRSGMYASLRSGGQLGRVSSGIGAVAGNAVSALGFGAAAAVNAGTTVASVTAGLGAMLGPILLVTAAMTALSYGIEWVTERIAERRKEASTEALGSSRFNSKDLERRVRDAQDRGDFAQQIKAAEATGLYGNNKFFDKGFVLPSFAMRSQGEMDNAQVLAELSDDPTKEVASFKVTKEVRSISAYADYLNKLTADLQTLDEALATGKAPDNFKLTGSDTVLKSVEDISKAREALFSFLPAAQTEFSQAAEQISAQGKGMIRGARTGESVEKLLAANVRLRKALTSEEESAIGELGRSIESIGNVANLIESDESLAKVQASLSGLRAETPRQIITETGDYFKSLADALNPIQTLFPDMAKEMERQSNIAAQLATVAQLGSGGVRDQFKDINLDQVKNLVERIKQGEFGNEPGITNLVPEFQKAFIERSSGLLLGQALQKLRVELEAAAAESLGASASLALMQLGKELPNLLDSSNTAVTKESVRKLGDVFGVVDVLNAKLGRNLLQGFGDFVKQLGGEAVALAESDGGLNSNSIRLRLLQDLKTRLEADKQSVDAYLSVRENSADEAVTAISKLLPNMLIGVTQRSNEQLAAAQASRQANLSNLASSVFSYFSGGGSSNSAEYSQQLETLATASKYLERTLGFKLSGETLSQLKAANTGDFEADSLQRVVAWQSALNKSLGGLTAAVDFGVVAESDMPAYDSAIRNLSDAVNSAFTFIQDAADNLRNRFSGDLSEFAQAGGITSDSTAGRRLAAMRASRADSAQLAYGLAPDAALKELGTRDNTRDGRLEQLQASERVYTRLAEQAEKLAAATPDRRAQYEAEAMALYKQADAFASMREQLTGRGGSVSSFIDGWSGQFQQWRDEFSNFSSVGSELANGLATSFSNASYSILMSTSSIGEAVSNFGKNLLATAVQVLNNKLVMMLLGSLLGGAFTPAAATVASAGASSADLQKSLMGVEAKAGGGLIQGRPSRKDNTFIHAATGEYVIPTAVVQKFGARHFDYYRAGQLPPTIATYNKRSNLGSYAEGGWVGYSAPRRGGQSGGNTTNHVNAPVSISLTVSKEGRVSSQFTSEKGMEAYARAQAAAARQVLQNELNQGGDLRQPRKA